MNDKIKNQVAKDLSPELKENLSQEEIFNLLEQPKDKAQGHLSLPVFILAKKLKKAPPLIAQDLSQKISAQNLAYIKEIKPASGFINFSFQSDFLLSSLNELVNEAASSQKIGHGDRGKGQRLVIDYSSPNVAKPMNIGHLRATVIGQAIRNLALTQSYDVVGVNHLGDWGVQFGKLAWAYTEWKQDYDFENKPFESLFEIYVRFHNEAEKNPELNEKGAETFRKLEAGDPEVTDLWKMFVEISLKQYQSLWDRLGVKHDLVRGESYFSDHLEGTVQKIKDKGLLEFSEGAYVVDVGEGMPPCLITKSDGASLYATRDIACAIYRHDELKCDVNLYVVGVDQTLHFKQVFEVLKRMDYEWANDCHHISFGMYRFKNMGKMSTRKGRAIFLKDVIDRSVDLVEKIIEEKNPGLKNKKQVAEQVGIGAIIFNDLINDRVRDVDFDWERVLDFEGDSGPYVQYASVRTKSLIRKYKAQDKISDTDFIKSMQNFDINGCELEETESQLVVQILSYPKILSLSYEKFKPSLLANYVLDLAKTYNSFYNKLRILNAENSSDRQKRIYLTYCAGKVLEAALGVLNIQSPEEM